MAASSPSKTRAVPSKRRVSIPATLTTAPWGASEPVSTAMPPWTWMGSDSGWTTEPSGAGGSRAARFSARVRPVTVRQSPWSSPASSSSRITTGHPPDAVDVGHVVAAMGLGVGQVGHPGGHLVEVVELELHPRLVGDGQQVEDGVGGAAQRHGDGDGVLERLLGHDLAGTDAWTGAARPPPAPEAKASSSRRRSTAGGDELPGQGHAQRLGDRGHGVGGEHPGARPLGGAGVVLDEAQLLVGEGVHRVGPDRLEHRGDVEGPVADPARAESTRRRRRRSGGSAAPPPSASRGVTCRSPPG